MRPIQINMDLDAPDDDGVFQLQTTAGAGAITLNGAGVTGGAWVAADGFAKRIELTSAGNISGVNFVITGFADRNLNIPITETIAGPNANTVTTTHYFYKITSITVNGAVGTNTKGGNADEAVSPIIPLNWRGGTVGFNGNVTGTINWTAQHTFDPLTASGYPFTWHDNDDSNLVNAVDDQDGNFFAIPRAMRFVVNSYTATAELKASVTQSDV